MTRAELDAALADADRLKAELDALRPLKPDVEARALQYLRLDWDYHSNAIEGNSLTLGETLNLILDGLTAKGKPLRDHLEIRAHHELIVWLEDFARQKEQLTQVAIREMHARLLVEPYWSLAETPDGQPTRKQIVPGRYKEQPNHVLTPTGEMHFYALPEEVQPKMTDLMDWFAEQEGQLHPVELAARFHYDFVVIHPFDDGNGRMARILMNLVLLRAGYPPAVIRNEARAAYISSLNLANQTGELTDFVGIVAEACSASLYIMLKAARGEDYRGG